MNAQMQPTTIPEYLEQLRASLRGADPAMIQDALYDAEEYLRSEMAEQAGKSEAEVIASVAGSYGAPDEVAEIYRDTEVTVNRALRAPPAGDVPCTSPCSLNSSPLALSQPVLERSSHERPASSGSRNSGVVMV